MSAPLTLGICPVVDCTEPARRTLFMADCPVVTLCDRHALEIGRSPEGWEVIREIGQPTVVARRVTT